ncbi:ABC transporter substrate-binding protein [Geodermatophilus sp. CPCC 206100]|uniref:ABC transporter substrate-binding protein n=1 Tax=Geodermatophilus sp. CPCC 206100 TaxID=3020054 RepID=UPI003AFFCD4E
MGIRAAGTGGPARRTRRAGAALLGLVVTLAVAACGGGDDGGGQAEGGDGGLTPVVVGALPTANTAALNLGVEQGFFEDEGLDVTVEYAQGGATMVTTLVSGDFDVIGAGYVPAISAMSQGLPLKFVVGGDLGADTDEAEWQTVLVKGDSPIQTPADLAGKRIAVNAVKGVLEVALRAALDELGVDSSSIELVEIPFPDMPANLESGNVDAAYAPEPFITSILDAGGRQVLAPPPTIAPGFINGAWETTDQFIAEQPEAVDAFVAGMTRAIEYAQENPDEVRRIIPTYTQIPQDVADRIRLPVFDAELDPAAIEELAQLAVRYEVIETAPAGEDMVYTGD